MIFVIGMLDFVVAQAAFIFFYFVFIRDNQGFDIFVREEQRANHDLFATIESEELFIFIVFWFYCDEAFSVINFIGQIIFVFKSAQAVSVLDNALNYATDAGCFDDIVAQFFAIEFFTCEKDCVYSQNNYEKNNQSYGKEVSIYERIRGKFCKLIYWVQSESCYDRC